MVQYLVNVDKNVTTIILKHMAIACLTIFEVEIPNAHFIGITNVEQYTF